jgi:hypothetical protein
MRREQEIGQGEQFRIEQRMPYGRRLDGDDIEAGAGDPAFLQGADQRRLVDDAAARRVDQQGRRFIARNSGSPIRFWWFPASAGNAG